MKLFFIISAIVYFVGIVIALMINLPSPVTTELALARAILWPLWLCGYVQGTPMPMD